MKKVVVHVGSPNDSRCICRRMMRHFQLLTFICCTALISIISPLAPGADSTEQTERTAVAIEALSRLKGIDLEANPAVKTAVLKVLDQIHGKPQFVELVR